MNLDKLEKLGKEELINELDNSLKEMNEIFMMIGKKFENGELTLKEGEGTILSQARSSYFTLKNEIRKLK